MLQIDNNRIAQLDTKSTVAKIFFFTDLLKKKYIISHKKEF